jgi:hypothetical protein
MRQDVARSHIGVLDTRRCKITIEAHTREITQNELTVKEVAKLYKVSERTVLRRMKEDSKTKQS